MGIVVEEEPASNDAVLVIDDGDNVVVAVDDFWIGRGRGRGRGRSTILTSLERCRQRQ